MKLTAWMLAGLGLAALVVAIVVLKDFRATLGGSLLFGASALISRGQSTVRLPVLSARPAATRHMDRAQQPKEKSA